MINLNYSVWSDTSLKLVDTRSRYSICQTTKCSYVVTEVSIHLTVWPPIYIFLRQVRANVPKEKQGLELLNNGHKVFVKERQSPSEFYGLNCSGAIDIIYSANVINSSTMAVQGYECNTPGARIV